MTNIAVCNSNLALARFIVLPSCYCSFHTIEAKAIFNGPRWIASGFTTRCGTVVLGGRKEPDLGELIKTAFSPYVGSEFRPLEWHNKDTVVLLRLA
jgi:hypothetical protein